MSSDSAVVCRYNVMYTTDKRKNGKRYHDAILRLHHHNSKVYLLSTSDNSTLATSFYTPARGSSSSNRLGDSFRLESGDEIEFEEGFHVEIGDFESKSRTNLAELREVTQKSKAIASQSARTWAASFDSQTSRLAARSQGVSVATPSLPRSNGSTGSAKGKEIAIEKGVYRGLGIAPPKSYVTAIEAQEAKASRGIGGTKHGKSSNHTTNTSPYARPSAQSTTKSLPVSAQHLKRSKSILNSPLNVKNATTTLTKGISSPFRPPTFIKPTAANRSVLSRPQIDAGKRKDESQS